MGSLDMDRIFKSLLKKGYLTDAEYLKIILIEKFDDQKSEVFDIMMVKDQTTAVEILNIFRRMTSRVRAKEDNVIHPLLSAVVADCIFGFLPTKDVLNCRLVCHQWRTASSNIIRKRVTINFFGQGPHQFLADFENGLSSDIKFQSFKFLENEVGWNIMEIEEFFEKCGANIKRLRFSPNRLFKADQELFLKSYDITPLILKACNLTKLKVVGCVVDKSGNHNEEETLLEIQLSAMSSVKSISVKGCLISIQEDSHDNARIQPLKITLNDVTFKIGKIIQEKILLNDVIDFSQATKLNLYSQDVDSDAIHDFDMTSQVLNTKSFHLVDIQPKNWTSAAGKVDFCRLHGYDFIEKNLLRIQHLYCANSTVNLPALPITIEKLHFSYEMMFVGGENINLPYLKYLRFDDSDDFEVVAYLAQCSNLVELEIRGWNGETVNLNLNLIPKSVKRIKLSSNIMITNPNANENAAQAIQGENCILNLDSLILENYLHRLPSEVSQMMSVIKPKVLVVSCIDEDRVIDTTSICDFVCANRQLQKVIVGSRDDLHKKIPFELSVFSHFVRKKKANYYQFENHHEKRSEDDDPIGILISEKEFGCYTKMDALDKGCYV